MNGQENVGAYTIRAIVGGVGVWCGPPASPARACRIFATTEQARRWCQQRATP